MDTTPAPVPGQLYDVRAVAGMLGLEPATLRWHLMRETPGIPNPHAKVGGAWVWRGEDLTEEVVTAARATRRKRRSTDLGADGPAQQSK